MRSGRDEKTFSSTPRPKQPYAAPQVREISLTEARAKLLAEGTPSDADAQEMLRRIEQLVENDTSQDNGFGHD